MMNAEAPDNIPPAAPDDFAAIPILLEPVAETPPALVDVGAPRTLSRVDQQSLFDDPAPVTATRPRAVPRRAEPSPELLRAAGHILKARAPAIIDEVVEAHAVRLGTELRRRLQGELESLLREMSSGDTPTTPFAPPGNSD